MQHPSLLRGAGASEACVVEPIIGSGLPSEDAAAGKRMRQPSLLRDDIRYRRAGGSAFDPPGLVVEPLDRGEHFVASELRF